jgi:DNA-binding MarR family transcriptional regulator
MDDMAYPVLKALIELLEEYEQRTAHSPKLEDFVIWLNNELFAAGPANEPSAHDELLIAFKLMYLNKELKRQTKQVLAASPVSSIDGYSFLLHLAHQESFRKMEIIGLHNLEAPTGIEVIKRLLKNKLIAEFADPEDGRAKRIKITPHGRQEVASLQPQIDAIFTQLTEPLSLHERIQLSGMLDRMRG